LKGGHQSLQGESLRLGVPLSVEEACPLMGRYVDHYNRARLHSPIGYVALLANSERRELKLPVNAKPRFWLVVAK
jgi:hypothetical protein